MECMYVIFRKGIATKCRCAWPPNIILSFHPAGVAVKCAAWGEGEAGSHSCIVWQHSATLLYPPGTIIWKRVL